MSNYIKKLEGYGDLEAGIIRTTKINKVLKALIKLNTIPKDEEFNFKGRSVELLSKWTKLLGTDGRKMSKSYGNTISLSDPEADIRRKLKTMVTDPARVRRSDPGNPDKCPVGDLHKIFSSAETLAKVYEGCTTAGIGCIECKGWAADSIVDALKPIQERRKPYEEKPELVWEILEVGGAKARKRAEQTMVEVRDAMGLAPRRRGSIGA